MKKKLLLLFSTLLVASGLFFAGKVFATGFTWRTIGDTIKFAVIEEADDVNDQVFMLPTLSGNDGLIYIVKHYGNNGGTLAGIIGPQSGDLIDGDDEYLYIGGSNTIKSVTLVADEDTGSWWVVSDYN